MIYVGIDVASKKHDCYITTDKDLSKRKINILHKFQTFLIIFIKC